MYKRMLRIQIRVFRASRIWIQVTPDPDLSLLKLVFQFENYLLKVIVTSYDSVTSVLLVNFLEKIEHF